jgi:hypothetical protein
LTVAISPIRSGRRLETNTPPSICGASPRLRPFAAKLPEAVRAAPPERAPAPHLVDDDLLACSDFAA